MQAPLTAKFKKSWLVSSSVARELICFSVGARLPTIQEFTEKFHSSRGIVQNALNDLQNKGGITLEKRGKMGTYISALRMDVLLREGGFEQITGTMASPLSNDLKALASGICEAMDICPVPFNFAFIQSAGRRVRALSRQIYDFAITSHAAARKLCKTYPQLSIMSSLGGCVYSPPFVLLGNKSGKRTISSGDRIAADPEAVDQYFLTQKLCKGKKVKIIEKPYLSCKAELLAGDVDFIVYRHESWIKDTNITVILIDIGFEIDYLVPAVLINRENYNIANILKLYLSAPLIAEGQKAVLENRRTAVIF